MTLDGNLAELSDEELDELRGKLRGKALIPGDPDFHNIREVFNAMHHHRPGLAISCFGTADVIDAVNFARERNLVMAVRGGGHSIAGLSSIDDGMLLDLSPMRGVIVDLKAHVAHVQGGALWGDVDRETQAFGLATPGGVVSDTGVGGLTLGGGYGWIRRKHGLSCDNVVEAKVVCSDGVVRTASRVSHPDLFWAIRGGGGNFGVVSSLTFTLHPVGPEVAFAGVFYPAEEVAEILRGWRDYVEGAPNEVSSLVVSLTLPASDHVPAEAHDRPCTIVGGMYVGDVTEGMEALQPLRELAKPLVDISQPMPYRVVNSAFDFLFPRNQLHSYWKSQYLAELSDDAIDTMDRIVQNRPAPLIDLTLWHLGGEISSVGPEDTAFAERSAPYMASVEGNWTEPSFTAEGVEWVRDSWSQLGKFGTGGMYLNFTGLNEEDPSTGVDSALGRNLRRLGKIKGKYDAANLYRLNNNIKPAT
ncbi:MAG TPA: FAD-binding protein [Actinomycetota bacterium]|nr:FAD-binding protein [Actinomycetota bacterium]